MGILPVGSSGSTGDKNESWVRRVSENLRQAFVGRKIKSCAANGVPVHFDIMDLSGRNGGAQTFSAGLHVAVLAALVFAAASVPHRGSHATPVPLDPGHVLAPYLHHVDAESTGRPSL